MKVSWSNRTVEGILPIEFLPVGILSVEFYEFCIQEFYFALKRKSAPSKFCNTEILHTEICLLEFYLMEICPPNTWEKNELKMVKKFCPGLKPTVVASISDFD